MRDATTFASQKLLYTKLSFAEFRVYSVIRNDDSLNERRRSVGRMNNGKFSIPTEYNGTLFRSKLEADWARAFDALGIKWQYEPKGRYFGRNTFYLVDFYLPMSRQWVEVKGVFEPDDVRKVVALLEHVEPRPLTDATLCPDISLVACEPNGVFRGWVRCVGKRDDSLLTLSRNACRDLTAFACAICGGWWFADADLSWRCQCCGAYSGNGHIASSFTSPLPEFPNVNALHFLSARD